MPKGFNESLTLVFKGAVIGVANIIPGVSGGTLAVILGIYDRVIEAIPGFFTEPGKRWSYAFFLAKIFIGAAVSILLLANVMDYLLRTHFAVTMFVFMGLILGGIPSVAKAHGDMKTSFPRVAAFILGAGLVLGVSFLGGENSKTEVITAGALDSMSLGALLYLSFCGFLAGGAMIVPGVSGSFVLVLLGKYALIIASIKSLAVKPLGIFAAGTAVGILVFSKLMAILLKKNPAGTYYFILGLVLASVYEIFPGVPAGKTAGLYCLAGLVFGTIFSCWLSRTAD